MGLLARWPDTQGLLPPAPLLFTHDDHTPGWDTCPTQMSHDYSNFYLHFPFLFLFTNPPTPSE